MKKVFADSNYWIAVISPIDDFHDTAIKVRNSIPGIRLVTTDEALTELLNHYSWKGEYFRSLVCKSVSSILIDPNITVLPQTRESFKQGIILYEKRKDKEYSLTDCISMNAMRAEGINDILTNDHHFTQEGFNALITREGRDTK